MDFIAALILSLTVSITCIMVMRTYYDWLRIDRASLTGSVQELRRLRDDLNLWLSRHLTGAAMAIVIMAAIRFLPALHHGEGMTNALMIYAVASLLFSFSETILAQRLAMVQVRIIDEQ